ncbi:MAG TPA: TonB family protein [Rhodopila sp.]|nr:TonB family protein [Rhodopila sp.]
MRNAALAPPRPARRRSRLLRVAALISLLLHFAVLLALIISIRRKNTPEELPPPAPVAMVFESGHKTAPTLPQPGRQASPPAQPPPTPSPPREEPLPLPPPMPPPPAPEAPPAPTPPTPPTAQPAPAAPQPPAETKPAPTQPPPPPTTTPEVTVPPPPAPPTTAPRTPPPVPQPSARPAPQPPVSKPAPKSDAFPPMMNFSFGRPLQPPTRTRPTHHFQTGFNMSLAPAVRGKTDLTPFADRDVDAAQADWRNALSRWVSEHAFYPPEARREDQEGDSTVHIIMQPNGRVTMVDLVGRSGSVWLDTGLLALFRNAHLPALPSGMNEPFEFDFTMHYVLERMPR